MGFICDICCDDNPDCNDYYSDHCDHYKQRRNNRPMCSRQVLFPNARYNNHRYDIVYDNPPPYNPSYTHSYNQPSYIQANYQ